MRPSFKHIIDAYLNNRKTFFPYRSEIKRSSLIGFHPSGMSNACPREIAFRFLAERKQLNSNLKDDYSYIDNNPQLERIFDTGHVIHMLIQYGYLADYASVNKNFKYQVEVGGDKLYEKTLISGTADVIIKLQDGKRYLVDIKTANFNVFSRLNSIDDVGLGYIIQVQLYMLGTGIPRALFYYWNKNDGKTKEFFLDYNFNIVKEPLQVAINAKNFLLGKKLPDMVAECKDRGKRIEKCPFATLCLQQKSCESLLKMVTTQSRKDLIKPMYKED